MQNSIITPTQTFNTLYQDLKELIFEFLDLNDLHNLQLVSHDFHHLLESNSILWSKQLFILFLDYIPEEELSWEPPLYLEKLAVSEDNVSFANMEHSRSLIESHFTLKQQYQAFFDKFLLPQQSHDLIREIFDSFRRPAYPAPCLKRDIHFFPTSTAFQNFLTEVHFGLHSHISPMDKKQLMIETIINQIKTYPSQTPVDTNRLIKLRWYSLEKSDPKPIQPVTHSLHRSVTPRPEVQRPHQASILIEEFNNLVCGLPKSHCQEVTEYLKAIRKDTDLLYEYVRFWNGYVLATMSLDKLFLPFAKYVNEVYNDSCHHLPKFPEFSTWRSMIKAWLDDVLCPLSDRLCQAFRKTMDGIRNLNGLDEIFKELEAEGTEENLEEELKNECSCGFSQHVEEEVTLLYKFYKTMCDLSCDEFTVFFEECSCALMDSPQGMLNKVVMTDTERIYKLCGELLLTRPEEVFQFLKRDYELAQEIFGIELEFKIKEKQGALVQDALKGYFDDIIRDVDESPKEHAGSSMPAKKGQVSDIKELDLVDMLSALKIETDEELRRRLLGRITMESAPLKSLFHLMKNITEELKHQSKEWEEAVQDVVERGFEKIEERHRCLFALNKDPLEQYLRRARANGRELQKL